MSHFVGTPPPTASPPKVLSFRQAFIFLFDKKFLICYKKISLTSEYIERILTENLTEEVKDGKNK